MYQKESISQTNNPFKRPSSNYIAQRPETPINNINSNGGYNRQGMNPNRSYSKLQGYQNRTSDPFYQKQNMSRSRISVQSSNSQLGFLNNDQGDIFPQDLVFLLRNEQKNINNFKQKIQKQKSKVQNDFAVFKTQIQHILQDVKISVQAELDLVYKTFITKYAELKGQVQQLRQLRKQILMNNTTTNKYFNSLNTTSNKDLIGEIEKDAEQFRNYKIYGYLSELQKQKLSPILGLSSQIILIGSADCPFYKNKQMNIKLKDVKLSFSQTLTEVYNKLYDFITTPQSIIQKQKFDEQNANMILKEMNSMNFNNQGPLNQQQMFQAHYPNNYSNVSISKPKQQLPMQNQGQNKLQNEYQGQLGQFQPQLQAKFSLQQISSNQQCCVIKYGDQINLNHKQRIVTDHTDSILCIFYVSQKYIATGSKDKTINVYSINGDKVATLRGHNSAICCLSMIAALNNQRYLASGSDHGCSALMLWDTKTWTIHSKVVAHTAAVTAIVDLQDGRHLVTGSYDKKINLFSHAKGKVISSFSNNGTSVTSMIMTCNKLRLVSSGLDNSLSIWSIIRKNNMVQSIIPEISISNDSLICQLQPSLLRPDYVFAATRNGNLKIFNISTGQVIKSLVVNQNSIIQLAVIERQMKPDGPIVLSCSSKDTSLVMTKMDTSISSLMKLKYNTGIQFGCGIGPKVVFGQASQGRNNTVAVLNQSNNNREFSLYEIQIK